MRSSRLFAVSAISVAALVVLVGWLTGLRQAMHGAFLLVAVAWFLPFVVMWPRWASHAARIASVLTRLRTSDRVEHGGGLDALR